MFYSDIGLENAFQTQKALTIYQKLSQKREKHL